MLCVTRRSLPVLFWLALPLLFTGAVLGVVGILALALRWDAQLSSVLFGAAAAVGFAASDGVNWRSRRQRALLSWPYPLAVLLGGIALGDLHTPVPILLGVGIPSAVVLAAAWWWDRRTEDRLVEPSSLGGEKSTKLVSAGSW